MTPLRVGLIGAGKHGGRYARHICSDLREEVHLVALSRRDQQKAAAQAAALGCRAYTDYRDLIAAPDVEAVIVVVPPTNHPAICAAIADAGKPALFEKPAAASAADAREMLECVARNRATVMVGQTLRYNSAVRALLAARDQIGAIHAVRLSQRFEPSPLGWIDQPEISGGGMLLHTGVHSFDLLGLLTGARAERVSCETTCIETARTEDNFVAWIRLEGNVLASVAGSRATRSRTGPIEIVGANGLLQGDHVLGTAEKVTGTSSTKLPVAAPAQTVKEVVRDFAAAVRHGRPMPIPLIDGLRAVLIADACYRSVREGRPATVEQI